MAPFYIQIVKMLETLSALKYLNYRLLAVNARFIFVISNFWHICQKMHADIAYRVPVIFSFQQLVVLPQDTVGNGSALPQDLLTFYGIILNYRINFFAIIIFLL